MPQQTVDSLVGKLQRRCPLADYFLCLDWIEEAFRTYWERRDWSWRRGAGQLRFNEVYNTGTASVTRGTTTVEITGGVITEEMVGRQWRPNVNSPIFTIASRTSDTEFEIDAPWPTADLEDSTYEIYNAFVPAASDCDSIIAAVNPDQGCDLGVLMTQEELDARDPQRSSSGSLSQLLIRDYGTDGSTMRFEAWPHLKTDSVITYGYLKRMPDLSTDGAAIPGHMNADALLQLALAEAAAWPGLEGRPNPYYRLGLVQIHQQRAERLIIQAEVADQNRIPTDVEYASDGHSAILDHSYHQSHDVGWDYGAE